MGGVVIDFGDSLSNLESCGGSALILGVDAGVITLGAEAEADGAVVLCSSAGGCWRLEKMDCRLSIARSCSSVLVGDRLALIAVVRALRQWIMQSSAVENGRSSVWC
jgi:hypothetical protein